LEHGERGQRLDDLVRASNAASGDAVWWLAGDIQTVEDDPPLIGRIDAVDEIEDG